MPKTEASCFWKLVQTWYVYTKSLVYPVHATIQCRIKDEAVSTELIYALVGNSCLVSIGASCCFIWMGRNEVGKHETSCKAKLKTNNNFEIWIAELERFFIYGVVHVHWYACFCVIFQWWGVWDCCWWPKKSPNTKSQTNFHIYFLRLRSQFLYSQVFGSWDLVFLKKSSFLLCKLSIQMIKLTSRNMHIALYLTDKI